MSSNRSSVAVGKEAGYGAQSTLLALVSTPVPSVTTFAAPTLANAPPTDDMVVDAPHTPVISPSSSDNEADPSTKKQIGDNCI